MQATSPPTERPARARRTWIYDLLLIVVLLAAAALRLTGLYWGEYQYLHPDERFLVWVGSDITPMKTIDTPNGPQETWMSLSEYFDTANSTLNPTNRGHGFYVYGTLPMFITRVVVQWVFGHSGFVEMTQVGRALSALADVLTVLVVYLVAARLYDRRTGLLAAAFSAFSVLQIQQSHFFTMDTFINFFTLLAFYFAIRIQTDARPWPLPQPITESISEPSSEASEASVSTYASRITHNASTPSHYSSLITRYVHHPLFYASLLFGLAFGLAMASKLNAYPMAFVLPAAVAVRILRMPRPERTEAFWQSIPYLVLAGATSFLVFRIFQPYAFSGPGFFGILPSSHWMDTLRELRAQSSGEVDFPPALQWARRPIWFSGKNMVLWGLGLPLGLLAWSGFLWAGWRMLKGEWRQHALIWGWTGFYFIWQSSVMNPTMRYQLPIYPTLVIFAAWAVVALYDRGRGVLNEKILGNHRQPIPWLRWLALLLGAGVLLLTAAWATAFSSIYTRPITRVEASRWIYQNVPGPINVRIQTTDGVYNQPVSFPYEHTIDPGQPYNAAFQAHATGLLSEIYLPHVQDLSGSPSPETLSVTVSRLPNGEEPLASAQLSADLSGAQSNLGAPLTFHFDQSAPLEADQTYYLSLDLTGEPAQAAVSGDLTLDVQAFADGSSQPIVLPDIVALLRPNAPFVTGFVPQADGNLTGLNFDSLSLPPEATQPVMIDVLLSGPGLGALSERSDGMLQIASLTVEPATSGQPRQVAVDPALPLIANENYSLMLSLRSGAASISLSGAALANEGEWDDGLPLRLDGYDAYGGIYPLDLNFNMYWDDNPDKLARFLRILDTADYLVITSSRQWASLPRLPERFPLVTTYYRNLLGCPPNISIESCYNVARPGLYDQGNLGFKLVKVFQSDPQIGPLRINDQPSEEAFTVYDHPKVFIFQKTDDYDPQRVADILGAVDFSQVVRVKPMKAGSFPANLMLPLDRLAAQRAGGTWSQLFDTQALFNRYPFLAALLWYLSLTVLGLAAYPLLRRLLPGLPDHGYPLARTAGLLLLSYLSWLAGSLRVPFTRPTIAIFAGLLVASGLVLAYRQRHELRHEWATAKGYFFSVEGLFLAFFLFDLLIRFGNPDLWHPWKGGEKPMDFSYLNAVLKSTSFPPYDPWFAGGYLNYYYYGFVFVGTLIKLLGIVPAIAYNLIIPSIFAMIAMGAFSVVYNLYSHWSSYRRTPTQSPMPAHGGDPAVETDSDSNLEPPILASHSPPAILVGLAGAVGMSLLGNLGTVRMIYQGYQRLAAPGGVIEGAHLLQRIAWAFSGFFLSLSGSSLPYNIGDWYWIPSRAIPAPGDVEPITEFPFFTVLYGDPHAHLFALPITLLALSWILAFVLGRGRWRGWAAALGSFMLGGLAIGALRPTNTWDFYPYLALGVVAIVYTLLAYFEPSPHIRKRLHFLEGLPPLSLRLLAAAGGALLLIGLAQLLYEPYLQWYGLGYGKIDLWQGTHTPLTSYLVHWGLFLFLIVSWMTWETRDWMASTPLSSLRKLRPYLLLIELAPFVLLLAIAALMLLGAGIAWLVLPLAAWAGILLLRPDIGDAKRFVLFLVGTGLVLTLMVEVVVLVGDIGRMNTVFKFYLQVWTFFAVAAAASLGWLLRELRQWLPGWRTAWELVLIVLVAGAALYPLLGATAKIKDRMQPSAPHTLNGMTFMQYANYPERWGVMDLGQDYDAIRWMQENVQGSPVIVEANLRDLYRWGSRFSIYTGLPGVAGWEWHQQQQRAIVPGNPVSSRIAEIDEFYLTTDLEAARAFLNKYDVRYIIVGQQERGNYPGPGLDKFPAANGVLWREVYRQGDTVIYEVIPSLAPVSSVIK